MFKLSHLLSCILAMASIEAKAQVSLFTNQVPSTLNDSDGTTGNYELGMKFTSSASGNITAVRFYKSLSEKGTHIGRIFSANGAQLASVTFANESASGWQTQSLVQPLAISANTTHVVSVNTGGSFYVDTVGGLASKISNGSLSSIVGTNGVFGSVGTMPSRSWNNSNYFRDVVFEAGSAPSPSPSPSPAPAPASAPAPALSPAPPPPTGGYGPQHSSLPCNLNATTANFAAQLDAAQAGQTICLASGNYGNWGGTNKAITITKQSNASVTMTLDCTRCAGGFTIDGLALTEGWIEKGAKNITIRNSAFQGSLRLYYLANSNILLDHDSWIGLQACSGCVPAAVHVIPNDANDFTGVTIQNSLFQNMSTDGIQTGGGLNILYNKFTNIFHGNTDNHTDSIQLSTATGVVVRGNYLYDNEDGIVAFAGFLSHGLIEDNVIDLPNGRDPFGIEIYSDSGSVIRHNTLVYRTTCFRPPCGILMVTHGRRDPLSTGTVVENNITTALSIVSDQTTIKIDNNMLRIRTSGTNFIGKPNYVDGANPTTWAGFVLAPSSPGKGAASDGLDVGIRGN